MLDILLTILLIVALLVGAVVALGLFARTEAGKKTLGKVGRVLGRAPFMRRFGLRMAMRRARLDFERRGEPLPQPYWLETPDGKIDLALLAPPTAAQLRKLPQSQRKVAEERLIATMRAGSQEEAEQMMAPSNRAEQRAMERARRKGSPGATPGAASMSQVPPSMRPKRRGRM